MVRQANLTALSQHPAWDTLKAEMEVKRSQIERRFVARSLYGGETRGVLEPEAVGYLRGFLAGMTYFLAVPEHAEGSLERFFKRHGITLNEEEGTDG
jgi:hypothetical protein